MATQCLYWCWLGFPVSGSPLWWEVGLALYGPGPGALVKALCFLWERTRLFLRHKNTVLTQEYVFLWGAGLGLPPPLALTLCSGPQPVCQDWVASPHN